MGQPLLSYHIIWWWQTQRQWRKQQWSQWKKTTTKRTMTTRTTTMRIKTTKTMTTTTITTKSFFLHLADLSIICVLVFVICMALPSCILLFASEKRKDKKGTNNKMDKKQAKQKWCTPRSSKILVEEANQYIFLWKRGHIWAHIAKDCSRRKIYWYITRGARIMFKLCAGMLWQISCLCDSAAGEKCEQQTEWQ